jgi:hypothetical protein
MGVTSKVHPRVTIAKNLAKGLTRAPLTVKPLPPLKPYLKRPKFTKPPIHFVPPKPVPRPVPPRLPRIAPSSPFDRLPYPKAGNRILADDFATLSDSLQVVHSMQILSSALLGTEYGDARRALAIHNYEIVKVMSVFGTELEDPNDETLDSRRVLQVFPAELGKKQLNVILTEAVETMRVMPSLVGLTYEEASERLRSFLGDVTFPKTSMEMPSLGGMTLATARRLLTK